MFWNQTGYNRPPTHPKNQKTTTDLYALILGGGSLEGSCLVIGALVTMFSIPNFLRIGT